MSVVEEAVDGNFDPNSLPNNPKTSLNRDLVKPSTNGVNSKKRPLSITSEGLPPLSQGAKQTRQLTDTMGSRMHCCIPEKSGSQ